MLLTIFSFHIVVTLKMTFHILTLEVSFILPQINTFQVAAGFCVYFYEPPCECFQMSMHGKTFPQQKPVNGFRGDNKIIMEIFEAQSARRTGTCTPLTCCLGMGSSHIQRFLTVVFLEPSSIILIPLYCSRQCPKVPGAQRHFCTVLYCFYLPFLSGTL